MKKIGTIAIALLLTFGLFLPGAHSEATQPASVPGILDVHGQVEIKVEPDTVTIRLGANIARKNEKDAYDDANEIMNQVLDAVKALGVPDNKIKTSALSVAKQYDYSSSPFGFKGYNANMAVTVTLHDFTLINTILDTAMEKGANDVGNPMFSYSDEGEIYRQALKMAVETARKKAEVMAEAGGVNLGMLLKMTEVGQNYYPQYYMNASAPMAEADKPSGAQIMAGEISITANVDLSYETLR